LVLQGAGYALEIPYDVLLQAANAAGPDDWALMTIRVEESDAKNAIELAEQREYAKLTKLGAAFELGVGVRGTDKTFHAFGEFASPIALELAGQGEKDACRLGGIYGIASDGGMEYYRGHCKNGAWSAAVAKPGLYALIAYDKRFDDLPEDHWANPVVKQLAAHHVLTGVSLTTFEPDRSVTRAEFAAMTARALGLTPVSGGAFGDVEDGAWYAGYVGSLSAAGIAKGDAAGTFRPNEPITREEMAVLLARALGLTDVAKAGAAFKDAAAISPWAKDAVQALRQAGYLSGYPDGSMLPQGKAKRAEAAQLLQWMLGV
jgi:hypothetical protein